MGEAVCRLSREAASARLVGAGRGKLFASLGGSREGPIAEHGAGARGVAFLYADVLRLDRKDVLIPTPPRLMDRVRHYSPRTEDRYVAWCERYIRFHGMRHPRAGAPIDNRVHKWVRMPRIGAARILFPDAVLCLRCRPHPIPPTLDTVSVTLSDDR